MRTLLTAVLLSLSVSLFATTYYVSNSGNDSYDGKTEATAWKTISKVNAQNFSAGDIISLKCGDTWREMLSVPNSGTAASYVVFNSYGTGEKPRILGSEKTTWNNHSGNVWVSASTFTDPYSVGMYGGELYTENTDGTVSWGTHKSGISSLQSEYDWTYSSGYIYVYSATDPDSRYTSVEIPQRAYIFDLNYQGYIRIDGLAMLYCGETGVTYSASGGGWQSKTGLLIENCEIGYVSTKNSEAGYGTEVVYSDMTIRKCEVHNCGRRSISLHLYGSYTASNLLIEENYFHDGFHTTGTDFSVGNGSGMHIKNAIVRRNMFYDPPSSTAYAHHIFLQNYHYSDVSLSSLSNIYIYSNIFISPSGAAINIEGTQSVYVYNNTFYNHNNSGSDAQIWVDNNNASVKIKNNLFYTKSTSDSKGIELFVRSGQATANVDADYNLYYRINNNLRILEKESTGIYYMNSIASIRSVLGWEKNSPTPADPLFVSTTDYHVQTGSPAIGSGLPIAEVVTDYEGNPFSSTPSIGAYECGSGSTTPAVPVYSSSVIENAAPTKLVMTYNLSLAGTAPAASAFTVMVNSVARTVSAVSLSGTQVTLTLASAAAYGDVVTVSYTTPAENPLKTAAGGIAVSINSKSVTNNINGPSPVYVSSVIENAAPTKLVMTYDLSLSATAPATSAFAVKVNTVARTVSAVSVSGTKVTLTLASVVAYGDVITVAYTKPSSSYLQTSAGGQAASITAQTVTNNVSTAVPAYVSSVVENAAPTKLDMTYNLSLSATTPAVTAFTVMVNSVARTVSSVSVSGTKVTLTLASAVVYGDVVTVAYTKPATSYLQTSAGGQAATITARAVTNNVSSVLPVYASSVIENAAPTKLVMTYSLSLTSTTPATTAFTVMVNSVARAVNTVSVSGTTVSLTLASAVTYGDIVTVAYTKPTTNYLQTSTGGQAASITAKSVTNNVSSAIPLYVSSVVENAAPAKLIMTYSLSLASTAPAATAFTVMVNSVARNATAVSVSGTKVTLTLASAVVYGDVVSVAYSKPATSYLQTTTGGQAATMTAKTVTNNVSPVSPVLLSSAIENATPMVIEMTYDKTMANIIPAISSFNVKVNYVTRSIKSISISGTKVSIVLSTAVIYGDVVTVSYAVPSLNALQATTGGKAAALISSYVTNNCIFQDDKTTPKTVLFSAYPNPATSYVTMYFAQPFTELNIIRFYNIAGVLCLEVHPDTGVNKITIPINLRSGMYLVQLRSGKKIIYAQKLIVKK